MGNNLKELLDMTETKEETEGLNQMITMMLALRQMIRIRESENKYKQKKQIHLSDVIGQHTGLQNRQ